MRIQGGLWCLVLAGCGGYEGPVTIAIDLPLTGASEASAQGIVNAVELAVQDAGGEAGGYEIVVGDPYDDSTDGDIDPEKGAANASDIVADEGVVAMIGPFNSGVAIEQIPITNAGGLFQCSPSNTFVGLTLPEEGADDLRTEDNNYVRVVTHDGVLGPAGAAYLHDVLGATTLYIVDDTDEYGVGLADAFAAQFVAEGGTVVARDSLPGSTADYGPYLTAAAALNPQAVLYAGITDNGGPQVLQAAVDAGLADVPFFSGDGIVDGPGDATGTFINQAGDDADDDVYGSLAGISEYEGQADFAAAYEAEFGEAPVAYTDMGYVCAQVVLDAIARASDEKPKDLADVRAEVRAAGVDSSHDYDTLIGTFNFDANGDTSQKIISIFQVDPAAVSGAGDWVYLDQFDFAAE